MDQIFSEIGSALGDFVGSPPVQFVLQAIAIYLVVLWLAGAYWAFRDMQHRTENPILPYVAASFVIVFTPIFFPLAIFVYKIIRPHEKIGEVYERNLAEEALLAEVESIKQLPDLRPPGQRRVDHLPDLPDSTQPRLPQLQPPRRARLVAVRLVRQGLRAPRSAGRRHDPAGPDHAAPRVARRHRPDPEDGRGRAHDAQLTSRQPAGVRSRCRRRTSCPRADVVGSPVASRHAHS